MAQVRRRLQELHCFRRSPELQIEHGLHGRGVGTDPHIPAAFQDPVAEPQSVMQHLPALLRRLRQHKMVQIQGAELQQERIAGIIPVGQRTRLFISLLKRKAHKILAELQVAPPDLFTGELRLIAQQLVDGDIEKAG